jgi:hypothetical protein
VTACCPAIVRRKCLSQTAFYLFETPIPGPIESKIKLRHLQQANHLGRVGAIGWVDGFEPTDVDSSEAASEFVDLQRGS